MNNERYNQIIDEVYRNYADSHWIPSLDAKPKEEPTMIDDWLNEYGDPEIYKKVERELELREKELFIHKIKTNPEFSKKWGLKIEERELTTVRERKKYDKFYDDLIGERPEHHKTLDKRGVPRKIITVTYKDEKIEVYE